MPGLVRRIADNTEPTSLSTMARQKRFAELMRRFPGLADMRVLDLGGTPGFWSMAPVRPRAVTVVNLDADLRASDGTDGIELVRGDACDLPATVVDRDYDLTFSNSLIEHVGGHQRRLEFARQVTAAAPHYWVQTPYRYFPIEPHWVFPGQQFMPALARSFVSRTWKGGHIQSAPDTALDDVLWVELLSVTELQHYFPEADIYRERFLGLTKSITAVC
jgi:SAM-dependent methyltransferase